MEKKPKQQVVKITKQQIDDIALKLRALPEVEKGKQTVSKKDAVKSLSKEITILRKKGYSFEQIAEYLHGEGLDIGTTTLKNYLQKAAKKTKPVIKSKKESAVETEQTTAKPAPSPKKPSKKLLEDSEKI
jgi:methionine synthase II (cobalamin-independent)